MSVAAIVTMVSRENAGRVAVDAAINAAAELTVMPKAPGKTRKDLLIEGVINSALWHYALAEPAYEFTGAENCMRRRLAVKAVAMAGLYALQQWSDSAPIDLRRAVIYGMTQGGAEYAERWFGV